MTSAAPVSVDPREGPRRWGGIFAAIWLFYLLNPLEAAWEKRDTAAGWVGMVATIVFATIYLAVFLLLRWRRPVGTPFRVTPSTAMGLAIVGVEIALAVLICLCIGQEGTATAVYIAVMSVICLRGSLAWLVVALDGVTTYTATLVVDGWDPDRGILFGILVAGLAIWGISQAINRNIEVLAVREENARLALEDERNRFARDLHDILGHSLTVITVKAELANRLLDVDPARARAELVDLERLSRDALSDVRRAVEGYRDLTLPGELARAREALRAAGIEADLPHSTDEVPSRLRELFAWTVREGVTNVIRHSGATRCTVRFGPEGVEVLDDGLGALEPGAGHGISGLRERAGALGAVLVTRTLEPRGFALSVRTQ